MMLYVVIGSEGEYSDRTEWVAGVFDDKTAAIAMVEEKLKEAKTWEVHTELWWQRYYAVLNEKRQLGWDEVAVVAAADAVCGDEPDGAGVDDFTVVECELNTWGEWETVKTVE